MELKNKIILLDLLNKDISSTLCFLSFLKKFIYKNEPKLVYIITDHNFIYENQEKIRFIEKINVNYDYKIELPIEINNLPLESKISLNLPQDTTPTYPPVKDYKLHVDDGKILLCTYNNEWSDINGWQYIINNLKSRNFAVADLTKNMFNLQNIFDISSEPLINKIKHLSSCRILVTTNNDFAWIARSYGRPVVLLNETYDGFDFLKVKDLTTENVFFYVNESIDVLLKYSGEFEDMCFNLIEKLPKTFPKIDKNSKNKSLLIETRVLKQNEFIIKNTIQKLGDGWGHIIYCHKNNYNQIKTICDDISSDIEIRLLDIELTRNTYNNLCLDINFWNEIDCQKVFVYQTDTFIFKSLDPSFLKYDWIGSPWGNITTDKINKLLKWNNLWGCNGGLNIRTSSVIKNILSTKEIPNDIYGSCEKLPEDTYYSWYIKKRYKFPTKDIANKFSNELNFDDSFGCHQPWIGNYHKFKEKIDLLYYFKNE